MLCLYSFSSSVRPDCVFMFVYLVHSCVVLSLHFFFFKQKTAYEMRISDWSSDVCSSDLLIATSNPFERLLPDAPADGNDLNPLLQDFGLILHPPMLYMGYVGFSVAFAFAIAALLDGRLDAAWARWSRPWTLTPWPFLALATALGSWWA